MTDRRLRRNKNSQTRLAADGTSIPMDRRILAQSLRQIIARGNCPNLVVGSRSLDQARISMTLEFKR